MAPDKRHTTRHNMVHLTLLEDMPDLSLRPVKVDDEGVAAIVPRSVSAEAGDELVVSETRAKRLCNESKAVRVNTSKMGEGQKRLLRVLATLSWELEEKQARESGSKLDIVALSVRRIGQGLPRVMLGSTRHPYASDPEQYIDADGDAWFRRALIHVRWDLDTVIERSGASVTKSAVSQALMALERRGLVLRDVPWGETGRASRVALTTAGWRVADALIELDRKH